MIAMLQEKTIEAIFDAGLHPSDLKDTKTGVFVGVCFSENDKTWFFDKLGSKTYAMTGSERSMAAHRLSYFLKLKGPSYTSDTACSSSLYALEHAYRSFRSGEIDNAIVAGINLCLHPFVSLQFARLGVLSKDGSCKAFDEQGNGYARSESVGVLLLQKAKDAKRQYAEVIHVKTNCDGYKEQGITFPSKDAQRDLMNEFYDECNFDRYSLSFLEAHGTGTVIGDPEECYAIDEVFTKGRTKPLLMGSVKSNIGHSEPASGVCSVIKCIIGMETGLIPPNIHYNKPRAEIKGLVEGRMRVVNDKLPFQDERGLIGINSFGFGGGNCHVLLRWNPKVKVDNSFSRDNVPVLVCVSGRTEEAVLNLLDSVANNKLDMEYVKLLHSGFRKNVEGHIYRGFAIVTNSADVTKSTRLLRRFPNILPPLYFVFGDLNNWCKIGYDLMALPAFADSIKRIQKILIREQVNILDVLLKKAPSKNISLLGSVVIQLALVDLFRLTEIKPNGVVGYSFGELISSYYNGLLSLEDTVHYAYVINKLLSDVMKSGKHKLKEYSDRNGNCIINDNAINGNGIPTDEVIKNLNAMDNKNLTQIENLLLENANESAYFKIDAKKFKYFLKAILCNESKDLNEISRNSIVLKLADEPLDRIENVTIVPLFIEGDNNCLQSFLKALGRLYELGYNPQISNLYPSAEFPVSRGTQMISPYIKWNHRKSKSVPKYNSEVEKDANVGARVIKIQINDETWKFVTGHVIDGRNLFPATAYLYFVWEAFSCMKNIRMSMMSVCFENCKFLRATTVPPKGYFTLHASIQLTSGNFEVTEGNTAVVTGKISLLGPNTSENLQGYNFARYTNTKGFKLKSKDIYKELRLRGYNYKGEFRAIEECDCSATNAQIKWEGNWVTFMDNMLQLKILQSDTRLLYVPTFISKLTITAKEHLELVTREMDKGHKTPTIHVRNDSITGTIRGGGISIWGLIATSIPRRKILGVPILESYKFVPNVAALDINQSVRVNTQIILENAQTMKVKAVEVIDEFTQKDAVPLSPTVKSALEDQPLIIPYLKILSKTPLEDIGIEVEEKNLKSESDCLLVIASNVLGRPDILKQASSTLVENGFIITRESCKYDNPTEIPSDFTIFTVHRNSDETILLLQKQSKIKQSKYIKISATQDFHWLSEIQNSITKESNDKDILVYTENEPKSGILGLVNCLRREPPSKNIRCLFVMDKADRFNSEVPFYSNQLKKHMAVNVYKDGQWGTYRHLPLTERKDVESEHSFANVTVRGDLSSLRWIEGPLRHDVIDEPEHQLVHVYYCALNFRDVMTATGKINVDVVTQDRLMQECIQGFEYSGRDRKGNRVMGMTPCGALSTLILDDAYMRFPVLDSWSLEEAATIPVVYSTVIYALIMRGRMVKGESILIHSGTGGVGQAAIRIALHYGCKVFTTVGSQEKREFLKRTFPQLKDHNIGNSHDDSFEQLVDRGTNGRGVDLVLNSLAEEKLVTSVRCLALGGRFIEIGKFDMANNHHLSLLLLQKEASFQGVMLDQLFSDPPRVKKELMAIITDGIKQGAVKPLTRTVFQYNNLEQAFRFMASGKHMGKVLIQIREPEKELIIPPRITTFTGITRVFCDPEKVYIITGGLGGFGLELADWLILRGARKVVLTSRKGTSNGYQDYRIHIWKTYGVVVKISKADITTREGCEQLIKESLDLGRIDAIFNLAVVLADGLFENQTAENFVTSFGPKAYAAEYLDELTRKLCPDLREFVVFSSVSCGRGNAGQTNYGMSNSVMERICEDRKRAGFPALAIQWGAVGEVGLVAEMLEEDMEIVISGTLQQRISSCLQVMDLLMRQRDASIVSSIVVAEKKDINAANNIVDAVINILGLNDSKSVSLHSTLAELGMDSMTAVEIKQVLEREFEVFLSAKDIRTMTLAKLKEIQNEKLGEDGKDKEVFHIGMEMMFRHIGDEIQNSIPYLEMKSNISENSDAPTLLLFPGVEGFVSIYQDLANTLNAHTIGIQLSMDSSQKTIVEMAQSVIPIIEKFFPGREFTFISYSYGTLVALEAISILESRGYSGTLIIIDGAPMLMKQMATNLGIESEIMFQTGLICHLLSFYIPVEEITRHKENIFKCETWDERVNLGLEILRNCIIQHADYYRVVANSIYNRTKSLMEYTPSYKKLRSNIKLFKPSQASVAGLPEDYGLSEYIEKPIEIQTIAGNHVTLVNSEVLAKAINSDLQRTINNI